MRNASPYRRVIGLAAAALLVGACSTGDGAATTTLVTPVVNTFIVQTSVLASTPSALTQPTLLPTTLPVAATTSTTSTIAASTTNPDVPSVTIARGEFLTNPAGSCTPTTCKRVAITTGGWEPNQTLEITCFSSIGTTGPYTKTADRKGQFSSSTLCFYGNAKNVYVEVNGVTSNVITPWKDW